MPDTEPYRQATGQLAQGMQAALLKGHTDRFRTLARQRNHLLQWCSGMLSDRPPRTGLAAPAPDMLQSIIRNALQENQVLLQCARKCLADTRQQIDNLARRRQSQSRLSNGYSKPSAAAPSLSTKI